MQLFSHPAFFVVLLVAFVGILFYVRTYQGRKRGATFPSLFDTPPPQPNVALSRRSLEGIGTMEVPSGPEWEREGNAFYNPALGMSLIIQNQINGFSGREQAYLDSYNEVNLRDAPNWERGPEQLGQIAGHVAARTSGRFHNGTEMLTRDYIFFAPFTTVFFQSRVPAEHAEALALTDYLASTFRR
jgi:hypothetical protein